MIFTIHFNTTMLASGRASALLNGYRIGDELVSSEVFTEAHLETGKAIRPHDEMLGMIWKLANDDDRPNGKTERSLSVGDAITLHDSMICPTMYAIEPLGFKRLQCSCEWADGGNGETGPSPFIRERDKLCPIHGMNTITKIAGGIEDLPEPSPWETREFWAERTGLAISPERWKKLIEYTVEKHKIYAS